MLEKKKQPEDLGIKIGSKKEALWTKVRDEAKILIEQSIGNLEIQKEILKLAERKIKKEHKKWEEKV